MSPAITSIDAWRIEILTVRDHSHSAAERRAIGRAIDRGLLLKLRTGACVDRLAFVALSPEDQHVVRMRALAAVSPGPVVFSHWSAAVLHGLPVLRSRLDLLHVTVEDDDLRHQHQHGVSSHLFRCREDEVVRYGELSATGVGRTVVDVAGAAPFEEGVMEADGALCAGVPRTLLESAIGLAGARRAGRRIGEVVGFAHPGAESAGESRMRVTMLRLGVEPLELQHRIVLSDGSVIFVDGCFRSLRVGVEFDGDRKYLDAAMAPDGAAQAVIAEKRREDEMRRHLDGLVRLGWVQAGSPARLRFLLADAGIGAPRPRIRIEAWCEAASAARPRFLPATTRWRA